MNWMELMWVPVCILNVVCIFMPKGKDIFTILTIAVTGIASVVSVWFGPPSNFWWVPPCCGIVFIFVNCGLFGVILRILKK